MYAVMVSYVVASLGMSGQQATESRYHTMLQCEHGKAQQLEIARAVARQQPVQAFLTARCVKIASAVR